MTVLITGSAGFIGSHVARAAHDAGMQVIALDNLSTSPSWPFLPDAIERVEGDVGNRALIARLVVTRGITAIVHFAGRIRVDESFQNPVLYFEQNLERTIALLDAATTSLKRPLSFILSSSAAVYGRSVETMETRPISPYGASKLAAEVVLESYGHARGVRWAALRYFNAAGAHPDGTLRESHDPETHLIPLAIDAALGKRPALTIYGEDYPTPDGTCIRDYIHVMDLANAHLLALQALASGKDVGAVNLGSGRGFSVLEVITAVEAATGRKVPYSIGPRRDGDPPQLVAPADTKLGWQPIHGLTKIVEDALRSRCTF